MSKAERSISTTEILLGKPVEWPKPDHKDPVAHVKASGAQIIYEDDHVIAFFEDEDEREGPADPGEQRISISPKSAAPSLMDLDASDRSTAVHLLYAIQQVTFKLGLQKSGYEIRANVLPPYQRNPFIRLKIRTGDPKKMKALG